MLNTPNCAWKRVKCSGSYFYYCNYSSQAQKWKGSGVHGSGAIAYHLVCSLTVSAVNGIYEMKVLTCMQMNCNFNVNY